MAFPFFGRKKDHKPEDRPAPRLVKPVPAQPAPGAEPVPVPPAPEVEPPKSEFPDDYDLASLDFTTSDTGGLIGGNAQLELREGAQSLDPAAEQAVMYFANGQDAEAAKSLEAAVAGGTRASELAWRMLFDLYQLTGQREAFDARGIDYAVVFEKSPPSWKDPAARSATGTTGAPTAALSGTLSAASSAPIEQLRRFAERAKELRIDVGRLKDADAEGGDLLLGVMAECRRKKVPVILANAARFAALLEKKVAPGQAKDEPLWLLLLESYQQQGLHDAFEDMAINYAVTFEKSPPPWEVRAQPTKPSITVETAAANALCGDVLGAGAEIFASLEAVAQDSPEVCVDCSGLRRVDFVSAGTLLNMIMRWQAAGKSVRLVNPNALVEGLFSVIGIDQVAVVERRKA